MTAGPTVNPLRPEHDLAGFDCGNGPLNTWLHVRARNAQSGDTARVYTASERGVVIGYSALAAGSSERARAPRRIRHNAPEPIPVIVLARMAVDRNHQRRGIGTLLLNDAVRRSIGASAIIGVRAVIVHGTDVEAARYYERFGFARSASDPLELFLSLDLARRIIGIDLPGDKD